MNGENQPFLRLVYAEINKNSSPEVPMNVRGVVLQCLIDPLGETTDIEEEEEEGEDLAAKAASPPAGSTILLCFCLI